MAELVGGYYDGRDVVTWTRGSDGARVWRRARAEHVCYLKRADLAEEDLRELRKTTLVVQMKDEAEWLRLGVRNGDVLYRWCAPKIRNGSTPDGKPVAGWFPSQQVQTYEADIGPLRRWMLDNQARVLTPRTAYLDIEADSRVPIAKKESARILSWTIGDADGNYVQGVLEEDTDAAEKELLLDLFHELEPYDQVVGWYLDGYDKPMLEARCERQRVRVMFDHWLWADHLPIFKRMNISSSKSGAEKQSMALHAVAKAVVGVGKLEGADGAQSWEMWCAWKEKGDEQLLRYNQRDVWLMIAIEEKTGYLAIHNTLSSTCGVLPDTRGANPLRYVDQYILTLARERGVRLPTMYGRGGDDDTQFEGAYVMPPPVLGFVHDVHVCDFAAMYPSIIQSWNMSPETLSDAVLVERNRPSYLAHAPLVERPIPPGCCATPGKSVFKKDVEGLFVIALNTVRALRKKWSRIKDESAPESPEWIDADRRSTAYKIIANTFYGVIGCIFFRCYSREVAQAVTETGQWMIKRVIAAAEARGMFGVMGDTDSCGATRTSRAAFAEFVKWCNEELFPAELAKLGTPRNELKLEYEKAHELMIIFGKKRYAARYSFYKGSAADERTKPEIKGIEYKRGDVTQLTRDMQAEILDVALGGGVLGPRRPATCTELAPFVALVDRWRARVLTQPLGLKEVVISKRLAKGLNEYKGKKKKDGNDAAQPPHVEIAKQLKERGVVLDAGSKIEYFVRDGSSGARAVVEWAGDWAGECDRYALWDDQVYPASLRLLDCMFPAHPWKERMARKDAVQVVKAIAALGRWSAKRGTGQTALF